MPDFVRVMLSLYFLSSSFPQLVMHSAVQVQRPQDSFQADTERPPLTYTHTHPSLLPSLLPPPTTQSQFFSACRLHSNS